MGMGVQAGRPPSLYKCRRAGASEEPPAFQVRSCNSAPAAKLRTHLR